MNNITTGTVVEITRGKHHGIRGEVAVINEDGTYEVEFLTLGGINSDPNFLRYESTFVTLTAGSIKVTGDPEGLHDRALASIESFNATRTKPGKQESPATPATGSRILLRRRTGRALSLIVIEIVDGLLICRDTPHAAGAFCAVLVIDPATAETVKGRTTYRILAGSSVYRTSQEAIEAATKSVAA